jgi:hypothetical protein
MKNALIALAAFFADPATAFAEAPAVAPVNLAPNSQWEIMSAVLPDRKWNIEGTGVMTAVAASANTTGSNEVVFTTGSTGELKVGDLITVTGAGVDAALLVSPMRVTALTANASVTVSCPRGLKPSSTHASTLTPYNAGGNASAASGDAADGWKKTSGLVIWREDNAINLSPGAYYGLGVNMNSLSPGAMLQLQYPDGHADAYKSATSFQGRTVTFGAYVYQKVQGSAGTWAVSITSDGAGGTTAVSAPAPSGGGYRWEEVSYTVPANATYLNAGVVFNGAGADTYYVTDPVFTIGSRIGQGNYIKPQETLVPVVHISPVDWIGASVTFPSTGSSCIYGFGFDGYAETAGAIAPTVQHAGGQIEGLNTNTVPTGPGCQRIILWISSLTAPDKSGSILEEQATNVRTGTYLDAPFDGTGHAWLVSGFASDSWSVVSIEFDIFWLK